MSGTTADEPDPAAACEREEIHCRRMEMHAYRRADGLFEVEGRIIDTKTYDFKVASSDLVVPAGESIHNLGLVLVFDKSMVVRGVRSFADAAPYDICPLAGRQLQALVGVSMTRGWNAEVRKRLERADNCTHLVGLLGPMATTAFQSLSILRMGSPPELDADGRPKKIGSCYAYGAGRAVVQRMWPEFYEAEAEGR